MGHEEKQLVRLTIDGIDVQAAPEMNLIEAARLVGIEIPFYCWHRHLKVAGNCRMCQVEIEGAPKLTIACNTLVNEGMIVRTHRTSAAVAEAQRAVLEFLLINHPLDCTVCDAAGHCKLQDYYREYNSRASRFIEEKVQKVKAQVLGPEVIYDAERCILCTRCVRFCEEVTKTCELGVFERGDRSVVGVTPGRELTNPFSGTVNDLCPVGALSHLRWRFNTRIWYTKQIDTICAGCSTGCNAQVAVRDNEIVYVKARLNSEVNKEWLCDEGRYGFNRFQPASRICGSFLREGVYLAAIELEEAYQKAAALSLSPATEAETGVFLSPYLTLEELWVALRFARQVLALERSSASIAIQLKKRELSELQRLLISPDYAPNARAGILLGMDEESEDWRSRIARRYDALVRRLRDGELKKVFLVGDFALAESDLDGAVIRELLRVPAAISLGCAGLVQGERAIAEEPLAPNQLCTLLLPGRTVNEKSGVMVNRDLRLQRLNALLSPEQGTLPEWRLLANIAEAAGRPIVQAEDERALYFEMIRTEKTIGGVRLGRIGSLGIAFPGSGTVERGAEAVADE